MNDIFRRVEQKYLLNSSKKEELLKRIDKYIEKDEYYQSKICNIYFDNDNNELISRSLDKPKFKMKVRLRSYNTPNQNDYVYLEIKNKYNGIVGKRRIKMTLKDFYSYQENGMTNNSQIMKELNYYFKIFNLRPFMYISYDRKSYREKNNRDLRITFDNNLISRNNDLKLELGSYGKEYLGKDKYIMEIKTLDSIPLWLTHILSELKIYPESYSKIGNIYTKERSEVLC